MNPQIKTKTKKMATRKGKGIITFAIGALIGFFAGANKDKIMDMFKKK